MKADTQQRIIEWEHREVGSISQTC